MLRNHDDGPGHSSVPKLIAMNDNGQLFFEYHPAAPPDPDRPDTEYESSFLVYDEGTFHRMPSFQHLGHRGWVVPGGDTHCSTYAGGSLVFLVAAPPETNPLASTEHSRRYYIWSKAGGWGAPQMGSLMGPGGGAGTDPAILEDPSTFFWWATGNSVKAYDNLGNALLCGGALSNSIGSEDDTFNTESFWSVSLGSLHGDTLAIGPMYPESNRSGVWTWGRDLTTHHLWSHVEPAQETLPNIDPVCFSPGGRCCVLRQELGTESNYLYTYTWYQGQAANPFDHVIFAGAGNFGAQRVNAWQQEAKPTGSAKGQPYRQGPLFISGAKLCTLAGSSGNDWYEGPSTGPGELNDRAEILSNTNLWRNNHWTSLISTVNLTRPGKSPGLSASQIQGSFLNNQGLIAYSFLSNFNYLHPDEPEDNRQHTVLLMPIQVEDEGGKPLPKLRVAKMCGHGELMGQGEDAHLEIENDPDRFYIRVIGGAGIEGLQFKVSATDNPDARYDDDATTISVDTYGSDAITKSMLMVSDKEDDEHKVDNIPDDAVGDRTHKVQLGGNFDIKALRMDGMAWKVIHYKTPVPAVGMVDVNVVILRNRAQANGGTEVISEAAVNDLWKIANERYAQCGIKLNVHFLGVQDPPVGVDLTDGLTVISNSGETVLAKEAKKLISALGTSNTTADIHVFYVNIVNVAGQSRAGNTVANYFYGGQTEGYLNNIFLSQSANNPHAGYIAAHELGHILTDRDHGDEFGPFPSWHLMQGGQTAVGIGGSKRLKLNDEQRILTNFHVQKTK